jgi:hypothetical protein
MGRVSEFIRAMFGGDTDEIEHTITIAAGAPVQLLQANPNRFGWNAFNLGANIGYIGFTSAVSATNGMQINPTGGFISMNARDDLALPVRNLWAIGAGASTIYIVETVAR